MSNKALAPAYDKAKAFEEVFNQVRYVRAAWQVYIELADPLSEWGVLQVNTAVSVFATVRSALANDALAGIMRLTDGPESPPAKNILGIHRIISDMAPPATPAKRKELDAHRSRIRLNTIDLRRVRNKLLSHADLDTSLKVKPLPKVTTDQLRETVESLSQIILIIARCHNLPYDFTEQERQVRTDLQSMFEVLKVGVDRGNKRTAGPLTRPA